MARRSVWLVTGVVVGAASSLYAEHKLRRTVAEATARLQPDALIAGMGRSARRAARGTGGRVREAVATGRTEMQRREQEIWEGLAVGDSGTVPGAPGDDGSDGSPMAATGPEEPVETSRPDDGPVHGERDRRPRRTRRSHSHLGN